MYRLLVVLLSIGSLGAAPGVMPVPSKIVVNSGSLVLDSSFHMQASGYSDARLTAAMRRIESRIFRQLGFSTIAPRRTVLAIQCNEAAPAYPTLGDDEAYTLDVTPDGATLRARSVTGAMRGMETFVQLIGRDFHVPAVHIEDRPRFPWRGLMMDVSRHWMPVEVVKRNLDAMAAMKLNVFHWHLSDDQGFRVESKRFPKLQELGSDGNFYTQSEVTDVVNYARDRGIRVVPEFDIPGHTTSWFAGYPELASAPGPYQIERTWGIFRPTINPASEDTYKFLDSFVDEIGALFPDPFFHIGGDEVDDTQWKNSAAIQDFAKSHSLATSKDLQAYFNQRLQEILLRHGKTMVGWDEVLAPGLASGTVIQSWRGQDALAETAKKGYRGILSFGYYLDYLNPASFHYAQDPLSGTAAAQLSADESARVLGGEACMWAEYVSSESVDSRIWPRMAAIAERLWSPREVTDVNSMYTRLAEVSRTLEWTGIHHRSSSQPMLDRLAPGGELRTLADVCESTGIAVRRDARKYSSLVDLNRFVDAVPPESEAVRRLEQSVAAMTPRDIAGLRAAFVQWAAFRADGPAELQTLSGNLASVGRLGAQALEYLAGGKAPPDGWIATQKQQLDAMEKPSAEVVLAAVRPVRLLLEALESKVRSMR